MTHSKSRQLWDWLRFGTIIISIAGAIWWAGGDRASAIGGILNNREINIQQNLRDMQHEARMTIIENQLAELNRSTTEYLSGIRVDLRWLRSYMETNTGPRFNTQQEHNP